MSLQPFDRLAPFIQEYIYTHDWTELRQVQVEACRVIFDISPSLNATSPKPLANNWGTLHWSD